MSQHGGDDVEGRSPPRSPQIPYPGIRRGNSQWSEQQQTAGGGSYFPPSTSPTTQRRPAAASSRYPSNSNTATTARRSAVRSASLASSRHGLPTRRRAGALSEEDEEVENADMLDDSNLSAGGEEEEEETDEPVGEIATPRLRDVVADEDDPVTLKERQSLINDEHPFGLPIWKPALYRKSRTVTREAETALHGTPSASRDLLSPANILWTIFFGWWLSLAIVIPSLILSFIPWGGNKYAPVIYGLGWYLFWPFGRYVEGDIEPSPPESEEDDTAERPDTRSRTISGQSAASTVRGMQEAAAADAAPTGNSTIKATSPPNAHTQSTSWNSAVNETTRLLPASASTSSTRTKAYGALTTSHNYGIASPEPASSKGRERFAKACYYYFLVCNIAPLLLFVCAICWGFIFTIPMAKLTWELLKHMFQRPEHIRFCSAPKVQVLADEGDDVDQSPVQSFHPIHAVPVTEQEAGSRIGYTIKRAKLKAGQVAPSGRPNSTVLLCIYKAAGVQYYKYTVGGVNIIFINLIPIVFFAIFDGLVLLPFVEHKEEHGEHVDPVLAFIASQVFVFILSLASVIPLSYFIGMAVASISAQSSIGMGAVINATFGSIIEIILYAIALTQGKGRLVEGSIVGSILAGVLLMPGASMCSSALRRKEQGFNAKSASVTSTMLIMAIFGTLTPTLFYQIYGNVSTLLFFLIRFKD
jgi:Ca2+:H+ antiporter